MTTIESSIDIDVPVRTAYDQWTQFEETFPKFLGGVESLTQITDKDQHWKVKILGVEREFDATITEQIPDERIAWKAISGEDHAGVITFHRISDTSCRLMVQMDYSPDGFVEMVGDKLGIVSGQIKSDLKRFKEFIESQGTETGAWRGEIDQSSTGDVPAPAYSDESRTTSTVTSKF